MLEKTNTMYFFTGTIDFCNNEKYPYILGICTMVAYIIQDKLCQHRRIECQHIFMHKSLCYHASYINLFTDYVLNIGKFLYYRQNLTSNIQDATHRYVNMRLIYVSMRVNYINMQLPRQSF